jgi:hypothetical protein
MATRLPVLRQARSLRLRCHRRAAERRSLARALSASPPAVPSLRPLQQRQLRSDRIDHQHQQAAGLATVASHSQLPEPEEDFRVGRTRGDYGVLAADDVAAFRAAVGGDEAGVLSATSTAAGDEDDGLLDGYNRDWFGGHRGQSRCVVRPKTTEELAAVLAHCHAHRLAVVPQGGNTGLVGGSVPVFDEVIVSTSRMNTIGDLDPLSGVVTLQAGVVLQELEEWLAPHGLMVPLDLGARGSCQLGGNASTAAGGARFARFGSLRSNIVGLEVVTADGTVMDMLTTMRKVRRREEKNDRQNRFHVQLVYPTDLG